MLPLSLQIVFIAVFGLVMGSFATALAWRIPRAEKWTGRSRSRCTVCHAPLTARDLVPVISWFLARGRCRYCGARISAWYPVTELATMGASLGLLAAWGWGGELFFLLAAIPFLVAHIVIDARHMILPDVLNAILAVIFGVFAVYTAWIGGAGPAGWGLALAAGAVYPALLAAVGVVMRLLLRKEAVGWGDVKFLVPAGLGLGLGYLPIFLIISGVFGVLTGLGWRILFKKELFPFGPALILSFYVCLLLRGWGIALPVGGY